MGRGPRRPAADPALLPGVLQGAWLPSHLNEISGNVAWWRVFPEGRCVACVPEGHTLAPAAPLPSGHRVTARRGLRALHRAPPV